MMFRLCLLLLVALFGGAAANCNPCASGYSMQASSGTNVPNGIGGPLTCGQLPALACQRPANTDAGQIIRNKAVQHCNCRNSSGQQQQLSSGISHTQNCPLKCMYSNDESIPSGTLGGYNNIMTCQNMALMARQNTLTGSWCSSVQGMFNGQCNCARRNLRGDAQDFQDELSDAEMETFQNSPEYQEMLQAMYAQEVDEAEIVLPLDP